MIIGFQTLVFHPIYVALLINSRAEGNQWTYFNEPNEPFTVFL